MGYPDFGNGMNTVVDDLFPGDGEDGFIQVLLEMYAETVNTLTGNSSVDEGNAATWKVTKG